MIEYGYETTSTAILQVSNTFAKNEDRGGQKRGFASFSRVIPRRHSRVFMGRLIISFLVKIIENHIGYFRLFENWTIKTLEVSTTTGVFCTASLPSRFSTARDFLGLPSARQRLPSTPGLQLEEMCSELKEMAKEVEGGRLAPLRGRC